MYDKILEILSNEQLVNAVIVIFGGLITTILGTEWGTRILERLKLARFAKVSKVVASGVGEVYEKFVRGCKGQSPDGKLTDAERKEAMSQALVFAKEKGGAAVKKYIAEHGEEHLKTLIEQAVAYLKKKKNDK